MATYARIPLSTDEETLSWYLKTISHLDPLTREEEQQLAYRVQQGDEEAKARLIEANLLFVVRIARGYMHLGLPLSDLIEEGNLGLMEGVDRFNPTFGCKLISHAVWWIRAAIHKALVDRGRAVRLPQNQVWLVHHVLRASRRLEQERGRPVMPVEIAGALGIRPEEVESAIAMGRWNQSLDAPLGQGDDRSLLDLLDNGEITPEEGALDTQLHELIEGMLDGLEAREAEMVRLYFGMEGGDPLTLEEIAQRYGLTRERVRQIKEKALSRLRHPSRSKHLREFWEN